MICYEYRNLSGSWTKTAKLNFQAHMKKDGIEDLLLWYDLNEVSRSDADAGNLGWAQGPTFIHSKTTQGKLFSCINVRTRKVTHEWTK
jgi:hypothetical protein